MFLGSTTKGSIAELITQFYNAIGDPNRRDAVLFAFKKKTVRDFISPVD